MRYFLDTEFIEAPGHLDLISIGIVSETGHQFYAESSEVDWSKASPWVIENVKPHLGMVPFAEALNLDSPPIPVTKQSIGIIARAWIDATRNDSNPEFWGYYADYDWVLFCWLQGTMMELPKGWPMYCRDLKQAFDEFRPELDLMKLVEKPKAQHHALADAIWARDLWLKYRELKMEF